MFCLIGMAVIAALLTGFVVLLVQSFKPNPWHKRSYRVYSYDWMGSPMEIFESESAWKVVKYLVTRE